MKNQEWTLRVRISSMSKDNSLGVDVKDFPWKNKMWVFQARVFQSQQVCSHINSLKWVEKVYNNCVILWNTVSTELIFSLLWFIFIYFMCMHVCLCIYIYMNHVLLAAYRRQKTHQIPFSWSYELFGGAWWGCEEAEPCMLQ